MGKRNWDELAEELQDLINYSGYEGTKVNVIVSDDGLDIMPDNRFEDTFYHPDLLTDFCRCKRLLAYATIKEGKFVYRVH